MGGSKPAVVDTNQRPLVKQTIFRDKHFYVLIALFVACTLFYYFGELVNLFGWESLRWDIFYTVHDLHRIVFLIPILYTSYYYKSCGALLANISSLLIFLPRAFFIAPYTDATLRMIAFVIMAGILSALTVMLVNRRDNLNKSVEALKQSEEKYRLLVETANEVILVVQDLKIKFFNHRAVDLTGYTSDELNDMPFANLVYPNDLEMLATQHQSRLRGESFERVYPFRYVIKDGKIGWAEINTALIDWEGRPATLSFLNDITERKRMEDMLRQSEELYRLLSEHVTDTVWLMDMNLKTTYQSPSAVKLRGYTRQEILELPMGKHATPESLKLAFEVLSVEIPKVEVDPGYNPIHKLDLEYYCKDGTTVWAETKFSVIRDPSGKPVSIMAEARNITDRKKAEQALRESQEKYQSLVENINDVFYALDTQGNITYVSPVVEHFTQYKVSDLIGKPFIPLIYPDDLPALLDSFNRLMSGELEPSEFRIVDKDGRIIYVRTSSRPIYKDGEIVGITALMTDITERKQLEQKLEEMVTHDFLTGLPNRVLLTDRFSMAAALAGRNKARLAVMSLDLDKFKIINDTLGHQAGDQVLKTISAQLAGITRASDTIARVGGDEFILVMMETNHMEDATAIAHKILDSFTEPLLINDHQVHLSTSIGIAIFPEDAEDLETLINKSDAAMYYSKGHGRNQFKFFSDGDVMISGDHKSGPPIRG